MNDENPVRLSPPQYTYFNFIKYSIGNDPCVDVLDIEETSDVDYLIPIHVHNYEKAQALATILELHKSIGNFNITIEIYHCDQPVAPIENIENINSLLRVFRKALKTNCYFEFVEAAETFPGLKSIFPVFNKEIIQFFNDDLSDLFANFNGVAADVFREVIRSPINGTFINPTTAKVRNVC